MPVFTWCPIYIAALSNHSAFVAVCLLRSEACCKQFRRITRREVRFKNSAKYARLNFVKGLLMFVIVLDISYFVRFIVWTFTKSN